MEKSYEELLKENAYLKRMNKELSEHIFHDDFTEFPWLGNLGHWFWDIPQNRLTFNPLKCETIGYDRNHLPEEVGFEFFTEKLHPEDYDTIMGTMLAHMRGEIAIWKVKYRIQAKDGSWKVFYDRGKITQYDQDGKPLFMSGIVFDVTNDEMECQKIIQNTHYWQNQARYDQLTDLFTRRELERQIEELKKGMDDQATRYSLMMIDIDHFKQINDTYGHLVGDRILSQIAAILKQNLRTNDIPGRYGGDEFIVILPETPIELAAKVAERIKAEIAKQDFNSPVHPTLSIGVASSLEANDPKCAVCIVDLADKRLYQAKKNGRNQVVYS